MGEAGLGDFISNEERVAEEVFKQTFIPQKMDEVINYQKDARRAQSGESVEYLRFLGLKGDLSVSEKPEILAPEEEVESAGEEDGEVVGEDVGEMGGELKDKVAVREEKTDTEVKEKNEVTIRNGVNDVSDSDDDGDDDDDDDDDGNESTSTTDPKKSVERRDLSPESWKRHKKELKLE